MLVSLTSVEAEKLFRQLKRNSVVKKKSFTKIFRCINTD